MNDLPRRSRSSETLFLWTSARSFWTRVTRVSSAALLLRRFNRVVIRQWKRVIIHHRNFLRDQSFDIPQEIFFSCVAKRVSCSFGSGTTGSANAVNVSFRNVRYL